MLHSTVVLFHICNAVVALISGFLSMLFRKGSGLHRIAGNIFFVSMLGMAGSGAFMATFMKPNRGNVMGGVLTMYLVSTAWIAAKRRERRVDMFDVVTLVVALGIGSAGMTWGVRAAMSPTGLTDGYPPALYFVFGSIILLFASSDIRMILRGGVFGAHRIARHLWRMSFALLFATLSLYPGQGRLFSSSLRATNLLFVPHVLLIGSMIFWMVRVLRTRRLERDKAIEAHEDALAA